MTRKLPAALILSLVAAVLIPAGESAARGRRNCQRPCRVQPRYCPQPQPQCCQAISTVAQPGTNTNIGDCICILYEWENMGGYFLYFAEDCTTGQAFGIEGNYLVGSCDPNCATGNCFTYNGSNGLRIRRADSTHFYDPRITTGQVGDLPAISKMDFDTKLKLSNTKLNVTPIQLTGTGPVDASDPYHDGRAIVKFTVGGSPVVYYAKLHEVQATVVGSPSAKIRHATVGQEINDPTQTNSDHKPIIVDLGNIVTQVAPHVLIVNFQGKSFQVIMASI